VSLVYMFVQLLISTGFVLLPVNHWLYLGITLGVLAVVYLLFMKKYYHLHREYLKSQNNDIMIIDDNLLDNVLSEASESPRKRMNFNIHKELTDPVQRLLNGLLPGTVLPVHRHPHTDETYVVLKGRMKVRFYSDEGDVDEEFLLDPSYGKYGVNIPKGRFHGVEVMEPTVIFEVKEGPYKQVDNIDLLNI
jgi:cupin fold WbuC family metalloprotein